MDEDQVVASEDQEEVPAWVTESDSVVVEDLSSVQPDILPVCQGILGRIKKASIKPSADRSLKSLKLELTIVDGIPLTNATTGETEVKYVGKSVFPGFNDLLIWADPVKKTSRWFTAKQYLLPFKQFVSAMFDVKSDPALISKLTINQEFCSDLIGRTVLFNVRHEAESQLDEKGNRVKTGLLRERIGGWKRAPEE